MSTVPVATDRPEGGASTTGISSSALPVRAGRLVTILGTINIIAMAVYALMSYGLTLAIPVGSPEPQEARAFARLADAIAPVGSAVNDFVRGGSASGDPEELFATYAALLLVATVTFVVMLAGLARHREALDETIARRLLSWAVAFTIVLAFAHPVLVQDFWLSAAWGEQIASGVNPYYVHLDASGADGLPLDYRELLMTYGPLWALVSGGVMAVAGDSPIAAGLLFKAILAGAWIAALVLIARLLRTRPVPERCIGIAIAGWLPLGAFQIAAEGHNDIGMVLLVLLWLYLLESGRQRAATTALAASVLIKYLSAPLFLLDLLHTMRSRGRPWTAYVPHAALAAVLGIAVFGVFFRSPAFFESTTHMAGWHFFTPRDGIVTTFRALGVEPSLGSPSGIVAAALAIGVQAFFVALIPLGIVRYWRNPTAQSFRQAVVLTSAGILLGVAGHLWPWFLVWALATTALLPGAAITRWTVGLALGIPFALLYWTLFPTPDVLTRVTPPLYAFVIAWYALAPRRWFGAHGAVS